MHIETSIPAAKSPAIVDDEVIARVLAGEADLFEVLMRRYNQRVFRAARSVLRDDEEAEDVMQDAYVRAFTHLASFEKRAAFGTWVTRIAVHEALARVRRRGRYEVIDDETEERAMQNEKGQRDPERDASDGELRGAIERAVDKLSNGFREVFMLRAIEEMSVSEVATCLDINEDTVKTRYFRARAQLRESLALEIEAATPSAFDFHLSRCDRVVANAMSRVHSLLLSDRGRP